jgi:flagellar biosynthesis/type III secretory pathway protein FliH
VKGGIGDLPKLIAFSAPLPSPGVPVFCKQTRKQVRSIAIAYAQAIAQAIAQAKAQAKAQALAQGLQKRKR